MTQHIFPQCLRPGRSWLSPLLVAATVLFGLAQAHPNLLNPSF